MQRKSALRPPFIARRAKPHAPPPHFLWRRHPTITATHAKGVRVVLAQPAEQGAHRDLVAPPRLEARLEAGRVEHITPDCLHVAARRRHPGAGVAVARLHLACSGSGGGRKRVRSKSQHMNARDKMVHSSMASPAPHRPSSTAPWHVNCALSFCTCAQATVGAPPRYCPFGRRMPCRCVIGWCHRGRRRDEWWRQHAPFAAGAIEPKTPPNRPLAPCPSGASPASQPAVCRCRLRGQARRPTQSACSSRGRRQCAVRCQGMCEEGLRCAATRVQAPPAAAGRRHHHHRCHPALAEKEATPCFPPPHPAPPPPPSPPPPPPTWR